MKRDLLFLCTGNSCRSQMAEGWTNALLGDQWRAVSAGTQPSGSVHPLAIQAMAEVGIDISSGYSQHVDEFRDITFDLVITVCGDAAETCPVWLREGKVVHIGFIDPAKAEGSEEERMAVFRQVRDHIRQQIIPYLQDLQEIDGGETPLLKKVVL